jgi:predicted DNA-binding transcriptional regulator YafY
VARNAEVVRQWTILREIENARGVGMTIAELAALARVTTRTVRRDLQALEEAGFPLYDDRAQDDGRTRWRINGQAFKGLASGLTIGELCALYFSRALVESLSGAPFRADVERAFDKLTAELTPHMRQFLDQLPRVLATKADPVERPAVGDPAARQLVVSRALDATLRRRQASITYHSRSSERTKTYVIHPYRLAYAQGSLYLIAYVPEYGEVRTFAVPRIQHLTELEDRFTPPAELSAQSDSAFPHSLGVHSGPPEHVLIEFQPAVADYVRSRDWHPSQQLSDGQDGRLRLTLDVCLDLALRSWILSFGPFALVLEPERLRQEIAAHIEAARDQYR